jgi:hypothetical protein
VTIFTLAIGHSLEQAGDILLVAREPVHRFGEHELRTDPGLRVRDQRLDARTKQ